MSTNYPSSIDNFINPTGNDHLNSATVPHAELHSSVNDAIEAIETVLGTEPAGIHSSVNDRITSIEDGLGSISSQDYDAVSITGGSISNLTTFDGNTVDGGTF
jgi:hypothetical protein